MNRAEFRRQNRAKEKKTPVYCYSQAQVEKMVAEIIEEKKEEWRREVREDYEARLYLLLVGVPCFVLHNNEGFGQRRLTRTINAMVEMINDLNDRELDISIEDLEDQIYKETGVKFHQDCIEVVQRKHRKEKG